MESSASEPSKATCTSVTETEGHSSIIPGSAGTSKARVRSSYGTPGSTRRSAAGGVFRFNSGAAVAANETRDHDIKLVSHGDDVLAAGNKTLWVVDVDDQRLQVVAVSRGIEQAGLLGMRSTGAPHAWAGGEDLAGVGTQVGGLAGRSL